MYNYTSKPNNTQVHQIIQLGKKIIQSPFTQNIYRNLTQDLVLEECFPLNNNC